ncbi:MAG: tetratricopeptide repeat protein [Lewinellaceae bacterium]|nr:tetratricopeptide repeat protein [Lewinellaceae bacterium]
MMKKAVSFPIVLILLLLVGAGKRLPAQNTLDSLKGILKLQTKGEATVDALCAIGEFFADQNQGDSVPAYLEKATTRSAELDYKPGMAKCLQIDGRLNRLRKNLPLAIEKLKESIRLFEQSGDQFETAKSWFFLADAYDFNDEQYNAIDAYGQSIRNFKQCKKRTAERALFCKKMTAVALWRTGTNYEDDGNHVAALGNYQEALDLFKAINLEKFQGSVLINFGNNYLAMKEPRKALPYYYKALKIFQKINYVDGAGIVYINLGDVYGILEMPDSSLYFLQQAESIFRKNNYEKYIAEVLYSEARVLLGKNEPDVALIKLQESLDMVQRIHNRNLCANILNQLGEIFRRKGVYPKSEMYLDTARALIQELNLKPLLQENALSSSKLYEDWAKSSAGAQKSIFLDQSLQYFKQYKSYQDSIFNEEKEKELTQKELTYAFEKKEAITLGEIKKQQLIGGWLLAGFVMVVLFSLAMLRQRNKVKKEQKRSDALLLNILPADIAEELKTKGSAAARMIDEVTVLFSDFKDFTQLSETLTPKDLVAEINECFSAFDLIMQKHGVEKIKTVGDAYLAAGGLPSPNDTHAVNVLNAALEMQAFMKERKRIRETAGKFFFEARIGVHTGPVVAGIVGIKKFAYDIWGDTVNTAQRMESSGEAGKVNISGSTYELIKKQFQCVYRGMISTKGKGEVGMYFVKPAVATVEEGIPLAV